MKKAMWCSDCPKKSIVAAVFVAICTGLLLIPGGAAAFDPAAVETLKATNKCEKCDLSYANLAGLALTYAYLDSANLTGANLSSANLSGANLHLAYLNNAVLNSANLSNANLAAANLTGADLSGADLSGARWPDGNKCKQGSVGSCQKE